MVDEVDEREMLQSALVEGWQAWFRRRYPLGPRDALEVGAGDPLEHHQQHVGAGVADFDYRLPVQIAGVEAGQVRAGKKETLHWPLTGFLLRSSIVEGWQGLEMTAYAEIDSSGKLDNQLLPLRLDRLGPDIMLCIFNGKVNAIEIKQPPEGLHFGAAAVPGENEYRKISLRRLHPAEQAGNQIGDEIPAFDVPMREGVNRVIDINKLASEMEGYLQGIAAIDGTHGGRLTSAEFAVQMVDSPCKAMFTSKK